jgi:hypothetical protein
MKAIVNKAHVEGVVYEHKLQAKVTGENSKNPGTEYITGELRVLTDPDTNNIVPVHFTYLTATTKAGKENATYTVLKKIIDGVLPTQLGGGNTMVKIDGEVGVNDFYTERDGQTELVSAKRIEGKFVHAVTDVDKDVSKRNYIEADMVISGMRTLDATENYPARTFVKGAVFGPYRKDFLPVEFEVENPNAISYFEGLDASSKNPVFTKVYVRVLSQTVTKQKVEESAFGDDIVTETTRETKKWIIYNAQKDIYAWDDESTITAAELTKALADRETYLATIKAGYEERKAAKGATAAPAAAGGFNF